MSTLEELFPDGDRPEPGSAASTSAPPAALGVAALVVAAIAVLGDLLGAVIVMGALSVSGNVDDRLTPILAALAGAIVVLIAGGILGILALALGVLAAVRQRGRRAGIAGAILGGAVAVAHLVFAIASAGALQNLS